MKGQGLKPRVSRPVGLLETLPASAGGRVAEASILSVEAEQEGEALEWQQEAVLAAEDMVQVLLMEQEVVTRGS